jgi:hypothetical protein
MAAASLSARLRSAGGYGLLHFLQRRRVEAFTRHGHLVGFPIPRGHARVDVLLHLGRGLGGVAVEDDQVLGGPRVVERHRLLQPAFELRPIDRAAGGVAGELRELPRRLVAAELVGLGERGTRDVAVARVSARYDE